MREYVLHLAEEGSALRLVFHLRDALQFLQEFALSLGEFRWRLHPHFDEQVAFAVPVQHRNAFAAQLQDGPRLRAFRDLEGLLAIEGWDLDLRADRRLRERNRNYTIQVIALAIKEGVLLDPEHNVQISRRPAMDAGFSHSGESNTGSVFDPRRDFRVDSFLLHHAAFAPAVRARVADHAAGSVTGRAGARNAEESLLVSDLTAASASAATGGSFALGAS